MVGRSLDDLGVTFSWLDLRAFIAFAPRDSAYAVSVLGPEVADWDTRTELLASLVDLVNAGNWQRAQRRSAPRPKPVERPSERPKHYGSTAMLLDDMDAFLGWSPPRAR